MYNFLTLLFRIAVRVYFKSITVKKASELPGEGPLIIVANHPSTFLDPIVIGLQMKQRLAFLAKAEVFKSGFSKWLLPKFNMIPVYRKMDDPSQMHKNEETFEKCYEHLARKGTIMIFPEGVSITQRKLEKIKTGAARIALGAEAAADYKLGVKILVVGLNYSDPHRFQSHLFMNMDAPIDVSEFYEKHKEDPFKAAQELTDLIRQRLENMIIAIYDDELSRLVKNIETIYKAKLLENLGVSKKEKEKDFETTRKIVDAVNFFHEKQPERVQKISMAVDGYFNALDRLNLKDHLMKNFSGSGSLLFKTAGTVLFLILGFPFWVFGVANNYLPYKLPYFITRSITKKRDWHGAIFVSTGTLTFILFYSLQIYLCQRIFHNVWVTLSYFAFLPISGFFAFYYYRRFTNVRGRWIVLSLFLKRTSLISTIIAKRQELIDEFEKGRKEFNELFPSER